MSTVTLSTKIYSNSQVKLLDKFLKSLLEGLEVETEICRVSSHGRVQIAVSGEDEKVALRYLAEEIGLCPTLLEDLEKFSMVKGYITGFSKKELHVDIGIFSPSTVDAAISLQHLQAQLVDGRKMRLEKIVRLFGFVENLPLWVKTCDVNKGNKSVETMLSERQLALYRCWVKSLLDRLVILGVSFKKVMLTLKRTTYNRDVVNVESLGLFEHAIVCKLGTDAAGLLPKIGRRLWNTNISVFSPRKIMEFLGCY